MTQIWPSVDQFVDAGTDFTYPNRYLRFRMDAGAPVTFVPGISLTAFSGDLSRYSPSGAPAQNDLVFARRDGGVNNEAYCCFAERVTDFDDGTISAKFALTTVQPAQSDPLRSLFVFGRIQLGSRQSASGSFLDEEAPSSDCVFFGQIKSPGIDDYFVLGHSISGTITVVSSIKTLLVIPPTGGRRWMEPGKMRMVMAGTRVTCYAASGGIHYSKEVEIFDVTDAAFALGSGRAGVGFQPLQTPTAGSGAWSGGVTVDWLQMDTGGGVVFRDEFLRASPLTVQRWSDLITTGDVARSVMCAYTGDGAGRDWNNGLTNFFSSHAGLLHCPSVSSGPNIGRDPNIIAGIVNQNYGFYYIDELAPSPQHHRRMEITFNGSNDRRAGIMLRGELFTQGGSFPGEEMRLRLSPTVPDGDGSSITSIGKTGYCCWVGYIGAAWSLGIWKFPTAGAVSNGNFPKLIATLTPTGLVIGTPFFLDFEVRNFNSTEAGGGSFVAMRVKLKSVIQTLAVGPDGTGISVNSDDWIVDQNEPLETGLREAMFAEVYGTLSPSTSDEIEVVSFRQEALSNPITIPVSDQPSIALTSESAGSGDTLTTPIDWVIATDYCVNGRELETDTPFRTVSPRGSLIRNVWKLKSSSITDAERDAFLTLWRDRDGPSEPFNWTRADTGVTIRVRFTGNGIRYEKVGVDANTVSFALEEVFSQQDHNLEA